MSLTELTPIIKKSTIFERIRMNRLVSMSVSAESSNKKVAPLIGIALVVSAPKAVGKHEGKDTNPKIKILTSPPKLPIRDYTKENAVSRR